MLLKRIQLLTKLEPKTDIEVLAKTMEELGELSEAILSYNKLSGCAYKELTREDIAEEAIDVMLTSLSIALRYVELPEALDIMGKKIDKWESKMTKPKDDDATK